MERRQAVFVVRMWSEPSNRGGAVWRGSIDNVSTKRRVYFANIGAMCEFMLTERERQPEATSDGRAEADGERQGSL